MKVTRKLLSYVFVAFLLLGTGCWIGVAYSNGGATPTIDPDVGMYDFPWFNATTGINAPEFYLNSEDKTDLFGYPELGASYIIFKDGSMIYAKSGSDGCILTSGTNAAQVIQATIDATNNAGGGEVVLCGSFDISLSNDESHIIVKPDVWLRGEGIDATVLTATGTVTQGVGVFLLRLRESAKVSDLTINMNGDNLTYPGGYVNEFWGGIMYGDVVGSAPNALVQHVKVLNAKTKAGVSGTQAIGIALFDCQGAVIRDIILEDCEWGISISYATPLVEYYESSNYLIDGVYAERVTSGVIYWEIGEATVTNIRSYDCAHSIYLLSTTGHVSGGTINNIKAYNSSSDPLYLGVQNGARDFTLSNVYIEKTATLKFGIRIISGNWMLNNINIHDAGYDGIYIDSGHVTLVGGTIAECGYNGINIATEAYVIIYGMNVFNNGQNAPSYGIQSANNDNGLILAKNRIYDNQGVATQSYAVVTTGTSDYCLVTENNFMGSPYAISLVGANNIVKHNLGYITENIGSATITSETTSVVVSHGCSYTPDASDIRVFLTNQPTNTIGDIWIDTIGSAYFTINCRNAPGVATAIFAWSVDRHW